MLRSTPLLRYLTRTDGNPSRDASDETRVARAFVVLVGTNFLTKLGDALISPKITLTWVMQAIGAHAFAISLLVPVRESGSMLPQLWMADLVNGRRRIRWIHQLGTALQGATVLGMAAVAWLLDGALAGWLIVALLVVFSLSRCLCSLVSKAVLGKVVPKRLRGQTTGWSSSAAGLAACIIGVLLVTTDIGNGELSVLLVLMIAAAGAWLIASASYGLLDEPDSSRAARDRDTGFLQRLQLLRDKPAFRDFVLSRALLMSSALVAPYYILLAGDANGALATFGALILASGLADLLSSPFWGRFSDRSSRQVLMFAGTLVGALGLLTGLCVWWIPALLSPIWMIPVLYFLLEIAHQGVRVGRKTYVVDLSGPDDRVDYVSTSNTVIGVLLLMFGTLSGALATLLPPAALIVMYALLSLASVAVAYRLPEVQDT